MTLSFFIVNICILVLAICFLDAEICFIEFSARYFYFLYGNLIFALFSKYLASFHIFHILR